MTTKIVSVVIPTHNRENLLPRAIESVLAQTYKNIELIVVDDASQDNTQQLVNEYMKKHNNIKYIKHEKAMGGNVARNAGIRAASGIFIAGLDDDDAFHPSRIELLIKNYSDDYSLITSDDTMVNDNRRESTTKKPKIITLDRMLYENTVGNQVLVKKDRILSLGGFDEDLSASQDYDMWLRVIEKYGNALVVKQGLQYIYISNSIKRISSVGNKKFSGYFNFYKKHKQLFGRQARKHQLARMYKTRNKKMSLCTLYILLSSYSIKEYIKSTLKRKA